MAVASSAYVSPIVRASYAYSSRGSNAVQYGLIGMLTAVFIAGGFMTVQPKLATPFATITAAISDANASR